MVDNGHPWCTISFRIIVFVLVRVLVWVRSLGVYRKVGCFDVSVSVSLFDVYVYVGGVFRCLRAWVGFLGVCAFGVVGCLGLGSVLKCLCVGGVFWCVYVCV